MSGYSLQDACDVAIIGAGPAGLAAAAMTAAAGLSTFLLDENPGPGGQIYRAIGSTPVRERKVLGDDYWHGERLVAAARASGAEMVSGAVVWSLDRDLVVGISRNGTAELIQARHVIIATGALERPFPIPGWTLPGVMTVGAAQTLLKASGLYPPSRTVIAGMGPLHWLYAAQVLRLGGRIEAILDTTPNANYLRAAAHAPAFLLSPLWAKGVRLIREVSAKVPIIRGVTALAAVGDKAVRAVTYATRNGRTQSIDADTLLLHQGVVPNVNLAMSAGVAHHWQARQLCFVPVLDETGATSVPGISIAGDGAGIAGAEAAAERGRIAALAAIRALRPDASIPDDQAIRQSLVRHETGRRFLDTLFQPPVHFRIPDDATIVCRCEEVHAGEIRAMTALGVRGPNQMKAFLRCGMGPCQGRLCGLTVTELIAEAHGISPTEVGYYRLRPPVKPLTLGELASIAVNDAATQAVVRL